MSQINVKYNDLLTSIQVSFYNISVIIIRNKTFLILIGLIVIFLDAKDSLMSIIYCGLILINFDTVFVMKV